MPSSQKRCGGDTGSPRWPVSGISEASATDAQFALAEQRSCALQGRAAPSSDASLWVLFSSDDGTLQLLGIKPPAMVRLEAAQYGYTYIVVDYTRRATCQRGRCPRGFAEETNNTVRGKGMQEGDARV